MGSWSLRVDGIFDYWSPETFVLFGFDPSEGIPTLPKWLTVLHPDDRDLLAKTLERMFRESVRGDVTYRVDHPKQGKRIMHSTGEPVVENGKVVRLIGNTLDITEQENAAQELERSEFYLREGERLAHMGSWSLRPDGVFDYWSPETFSIFGFAPTNGIPTLKEWLSVLHSVDSDRVHALIQKMFSDGVKGDIQYGVDHPHHGQRTMHSTGDPVFQDGKVVRLIGNTLDITEQEKAVQELQRSEAYLAEAQRLSHTGSFGWDVSTGEIFWSDETFRIFEFDPKTEITTELIVQRTHPDDRQAVQQLIERASSERTEFALEHRLLMPDGSIKFVHVVGHPSTDEGRHSEFVGAVTDITNHRRAE